MAKSLTVSSGSLNVNPTITRYCPVGGQFNTSSTEGSEQVPCRVAGTARNPYAYITAAGPTNDSTITLRASAADTSVVITIPNGSTGVNSNTTSDSLANTDEINWEITSGSGGTTLTFNVLGFEFEPTDSTKTTNFQCQSTQSSNMNANDTTWYQLLSGDSSFTNTTEANVQYTMRADFTCSNLYVFIANIPGSTVNVRSRVDSANGNQVIQVLTTDTDETAKEDTSNSDSVSSGSTYNYAITTGNPAGIFRCRILCSTIVSDNSDGNFIMMCGRNNGTVITTDQTAYVSCAGDITVEESTENNVEIVPPFDFDVSNLQSYVSSIGNTLDVALRVDGADSSTFAHQHTVTGLLSTNGTESIVSTNTINYKILGGSSVSNSGVPWVAIMAAESAGAGGALQDIIQMGIIPFPR